MFCINCFNNSTKVLNSRPHKKQPSVWRRRKCQNCGTLFTTYERPSLADNKKITLSDNKTETFNLGKLIQSIAKAFAHSPHHAQYSSLWLAMSVEDILSTQREVITTEDITATTHDVLKHYDPLAAMQYAAQHNLIASSRKRRGRPSLVWHEPPTDASLSR
jgi:transcriptional repressor NrdR